MPTDGIPGYAGLGATTDGIVPAERGTWSQLVDLNGDGRPDLVYRAAANGFGNTMRLVPGAPLQGGGSMFVTAQERDIPQSLLGFPDKPLERETITHIPADLDPTNHGRSGRDQDVWRQLIDWNGDGRVDIVDAHEVEGQWVVYLNTPGAAGPWDIRWRREAIHVESLVDTLRDQHSYTFDGHWLPLSRRHSGMVDTMQVCFACPAHTTCKAGSSDWQFVDNFSTLGTCSPISEVPGTVGTLYENEHIIQSTYVQWELRDINGDGYVDVVFNDVGILTDTEVNTPPAHDEVCGSGTCLQEAGFRNHVVALPATGVDAVINLAGPLLSAGESGVSNYPFSAPVQLRAAGNTVRVTNRAGTSLTPANPKECGVALWAGAVPEGIINHITQNGFVDQSTQYCGFSDINGDGLADRVEGTVVYLQNTDASFGAFKLQLPSFIQAHTDPSRPRCCNDPTSPCGEDIFCDPVTHVCSPPRPRPTFIDAEVEQEFALKDINGDGIRTSWTTNSSTRPTLTI